MVGLGGLEPPTSRLSGGRSNRLSYRPGELAAPVARVCPLRSTEDLGSCRPTSSSYLHTNERGREHSGLQKLNSAWFADERCSVSTPIERVTGKTRDSYRLAIQRLRVEGVSNVTSKFALLSSIAHRSRVTGEDLLTRSWLLRKEVIQPQVPLRLPCYDFTPITSHTLGGSLPKVGSPTSGSTSFRGVTGGVYKARERIHRGMLIRDY